MLLAGVFMYPIWKAFIKGITSRIHQSWVSMTHNAFNVLFNKKKMKKNVFLLEINKIHNFAAFQWKISKLKPLTKKNFFACRTIKSCL